MSDSFQVAAQSGEVLAQSHLAEEMRHHANGEELFPVLLGEQVEYFHDVGGGYHRSEGYHVINLIHRIQGPESPPSNPSTDSIEAHIGDSYFYLESEDEWSFGDYPDEDYTLSLKVTGYQEGPYAFTEELQTEVDKRETDYEWEG